MNGCSPIRLPAMIQLWLVELERRLRKLEGRELIKQTIVETAEILVPLGHAPILPTIKFDVNDVLSVSSLVLIFNHASAWNTQWQRYFEESWPTAIAVFCTCFDVFNEALCRVEDVTKFTLHRYRVFEHSLIDFDCADLLCECLVALLHLCNCVRQSLVRFYKFSLALFVNWFSVIVSLLLLFLALNGLH